MPKPHPTTALCGAKSKTTGQPCQNRAGKGTDHVGFGRCKWHGGNTASHRHHAAALEAKARMVALSVPVEDAGPHAVLLSELRYSAGHTAWLRQEITALEPDEIGGERSKVLLSRLDSQRDPPTPLA